MKPEEMEYYDDEGMLHVMCACGHTVSGGVKPGDKLATCPNCKLTLLVMGRVPVVYPEQLPDNLRPEQR